MIINKEPVLHLTPDIFEYVADEDVLTATYAGVTDVFDFTDLPEGVRVGPSDIETTLAYNPIVGATRTNGELNLSVIHFIKPTEE